MLDIDRDLFLSCEHALQLGISDAHCSQYSTCSVSTLSISTDLSVVPLQ